MMNFADRRRARAQCDIQAGPGALFYTKTYAETDGICLEHDGFCTETDGFSSADAAANVPHGDQARDLLRVRGPGYHPWRGLHLWMNFDEFCIRNDEFCMKNDGFCMKNDCILTASGHDEWRGATHAWQLVRVSKNDAFCIRNERILYRKRGFLNLQWWISQGERQPVRFLCWKWRFFNSF